MVITCPRGWRGVYEIRADSNKNRHLESQHIQTLISKGREGRGGTRGWHKAGAEEQQITLVPKAKSGQTGRKEDKNGKNIQSVGFSLYQ